MLGSRGQAFDAMKFLQGAIIAVVLLGIVYGALQMVKQYEPGSDVLTISADLLASAYSAAGTGISFTREAKLKPMQIDGDSVKEKAGIDDNNLKVEFCCDQPVAKEAIEGTCGKTRCVRSITLEKGATIPICVVCDNLEQCYIHLGARDC